MVDFFLVRIEKMNFFFKSSSDHLVDEGVDFSFSVTPISLGHEWVSLVSISSSWVVKFEWPDEVVGSLEVGSTGSNFVDEVLNTGDSDLS